MKNKKFGLILALFLVNSAIALGDPFILALGNYLHNHFTLVFPDGYMNTLHNQVTMLGNLLTAYYQSRDTELTSLNLNTAA